MNTNDINNTGINEQENEHEGMVQCAICGEWVDEDDTYETREGDIICADCYDEGFGTCADCGAIVPLDELVTVNHGWRDEADVCSSCLEDYSRCDVCDEYVSDNHIADSNWEHVICDGCADDGRFHLCSDCGAIIDTFYEDYSTTDFDYYCSGCKRDRTKVHPYSYKPAPIIYRRRTEEHALIFGVELEVDRGHSASDLADDLDALDLPIYCKEDGSLGGEGVEIVTHPATLACHANDVGWQEITDACLRHGYTSHNTSTCGLHVHVGREELGATDDERYDTADKMVLTVAAIWDKLTLFTRRDVDRLNHWAGNPIHPEDVMGLSDTDLLLTANRLSRNNRYHAVNLLNSATVEIRVFRGTLKPGTILASIQLVSNIAKYSMTHTPSACIRATWADIISVDTYPELTQYLTERGLLA